MELLRLIVPLSGRKKRETRGAVALPLPGSLLEVVFGYLVGPSADEVERLAEGTSKGRRDSSLFTRRQRSLSLGDLIGPVIKRSAFRGSRGQIRAIPRGGMARPAKSLAVSISLSLSLSCVRPRVGRVKR